MKIKSPKSEARRILKDYGIDVIPVDVEALCMKMSLHLHYGNLSELEQITGRDISGLIHRTDDRKYVIIVNERDIEPRRRFTVAHEIGHRVLHMDDETSGIITSFRSDRSSRETQANIFAAELLMPEPHVLEEYRKLVIPVCDTLAKRFGVSKQAMRFRLDELELLYV